jgi:hypothetical protein
MHNLFHISNNIIHDNGQLQNSDDILWLYDMEGFVHNAKVLNKEN